ncbi:sphingosine hydroxylase [Vararia minispora EC-137]|uniref:Sphingosine hydroxylase n=1 Tax=Vararia minispora EC-137 TaxID=1314806 RepID=A0ACB8Q8J6_9AGAM|nr:sphingosine hydroxylase [Vararia minispora EC-137]
MAVNITDVLFPPSAFSSKTPFYFSAAPEYIPGISDHYLSIFAPIVIHWAVAGFFHALDCSEADWIVRHRIHESAEVKSRNRVSRLEVLRAVIFQQVVQMSLAYFWMDSAPHHVEPRAEMSILAGRMYLALGKLVGQGAAYAFMKAGGPDMVWAMYWWIIPVVQFFIAMFVVDTWQYFLHRAMHINKRLYRLFHSWHHRLYVPYAFGALYNHPVEGFLLDTLGSAVGEVLAGFSVRQATLFFIVATCKTLDDHCGYSFPWDPLQMLSGNTADYHDIHHQMLGIKSNFSQPFFVHWDVLLGTRMTREELIARKAGHSAPSSKPTDAKKIE